MLYFYTPYKHQETKGFLTFSEDREVKHLRGIGKLFVNDFVQVFGHMDEYFSVYTFSN